MKLNKLLQKIFKNFFQSLFKIFIGNIELNNNTDNQNILVHEINSLQIDKKIYNLKKNL